MTDHQPILPERSLTHIFKADAATAILRARQAFDAAESKLSEFKEARDLALKNIDDESAVAEVQRLDHEIEAHQHAATIYNERIRALLERQRAEEHAKREVEKIAAVATIGRLVARRHTAAQKADDLITALGTALANLEAADDAIFANWSPLLSEAYGARSLTIRGLRTFGTEQVREHGKLYVRQIKGTLRAIADSGSGYDLAEISRDRGKQLIEILEAVRIPEPQPLPSYDDEEENAA
jgi:hypothetical protein